MPDRSLYSRNVDNPFMASRCIIELVNFSARTGLPEINNGYVCLAIDDP